MTDKMDDKNLYMPVDFWSGILKVLDDRVHRISTTYGFGEVTLKLIVRHNKIQQTVFTEEVAIRHPKDEKTQKDTSK